MDDYVKNMLEDFPIKVNKDSKQETPAGFTLTFIGGSTAIGQDLPPHLQFPTTATAPERMKLNSEIAVHLCHALGQWGLPGVKAMPVAVGMNQKGGMDDEEFAKFVQNSIMPL
ncbi:unnamed protein product [Cylindrotheca closterium]|uniref:Uncharacterized protein n=1 Tax=Cylindrotheca closterium TaxID=2856 RepID=A0AAD2FFD4_9STRA|nr:unnamed protein product [Cylindrotheca closterium]